MFKKINFWLDNARVYSLPLTILSWLVIFLYSIKHGGNWFLGIVALVGICFVHLATNLADDYFDYKILSAKEIFINSAQDCKCKYLKDSRATVHELGIAIISMLLIAAVIGVFLFFMSGFYVLILALIALFIVFSYSKLSVKGLGEIAVITAYGPLMFEGVYYVMTKHFSWHALILSFACAFVVNTILYVHMLMDYDGDECSHKITLCRKFNSKDKALNFLFVFYLLAYIMVLWQVLSTKNYLYLISYLTIPATYLLYKTLKVYNFDKTRLPKPSMWMFPLGSASKLETTEDASFYSRFFMVRNIATVYMLFICVAILFGK